MLAAFAVLALLATGDTLAPASDNLAPLPDTAAFRATAEAILNAPPAPRGPRLDLLYREPFAPFSLTTPAAVAVDSGRPKAKEYGSGYATRLKIHQITSWLMFPLFVTQYFVGQDLYENGSQASSFSRDWHQPLAVAIAGVFTVQAVTGVWNLVDSWSDPAGGTRRKIHSIAMLVASAGFVGTAMTAPELEDDGDYGFDSEGEQDTHRALAIGSMAVATAAWVMMLLWKD